MDELDEIVGLEKAAEKMMNERSGASRKRAEKASVVVEETGTAVSTDTQEVSGTQASGPDPVQTAQTVSETERLYREILDRLNNLPDGIVAALRAGGAVPAKPNSMYKKFWFRRDRTVAEGDRNDFASLDDVKPDTSEDQQRRQDAEHLLKAVEDRLFSHAMTHQSSLVVLIGWTLALVSLGVGMAWGYIAGAAHFPAWWPRPGAGLMDYLASAFLGAPVGIVLLPVSGLIVWRIADDEAMTNKARTALKTAAVLLGIGGIALPFLGLL